MYNVVCGALKKSQVGQVEHWFLELSNDEAFELTGKLWRNRIHYELYRGNELIAVHDAL